MAPRPRRTFYNLRLHARRALRGLLALPRRGPGSQRPPSLTILAVLANIALALSIAVSPWALIAVVPIAAVALLVVYLARG